MYLVVALSPKSTSLGSLSEERLAESRRVRALVWKRARRVLFVHGEVKSFNATVYFPQGSGRMAPSSQSTGLFDQPKTEVVFLVSLNMPLAIIMLTYPNESFSISLSQVVPPDSSHHMDPPNSFRDSEKKQWSRPHEGKARTSVVSILFVALEFSVLRSTPVLFL